eukprot:624624_1
MPMYYPAYSMSRVQPASLAPSRTPVSMVPQSRAPVSMASPHTVHMQPLPMHSTSSKPLSVSVPPPPPPPRVPNSSIQKGRLSSNFVRRPPQRTTLPIPLSNSSVSGRRPILISQMPQYLPTSRTSSRPISHQLPTPLSNLNFQFQTPLSQHSRPSPLGAPPATQFSRPFQTPALISNKRTLSSLSVQNRVSTDLARKQQCLTQGNVVTFQRAPIPTPGSSMR